MLLPIFFHSSRKTAVEPVKLRPANCSCCQRPAATSAPEPCTRLITPGGKPASSNTRMTTSVLSAAFSDGFQTTVLPISAGDGRAGSRRSR